MQQQQENFHCQFHFLEPEHFCFCCCCCCSSSFFGGIAVCGIVFFVCLLVAVEEFAGFFPCGVKLCGANFLSNFCLFCQHLRAVMTDELIKLATITDMKVKKRIPEVFVKVTHTVWSGAHSAWVSWYCDTGTSESLKFCDFGRLKATSSGLRTCSELLVLTSPKLVFFISSSCRFTRWFWKLW